MHHHPPKPPPSPVNAEPPTPPQRGLVCNPFLEHPAFGRSRRCGLRHRGAERARFSRYRFLPPAGQRDTSRPPGCAPPCRSTRALGGGGGRGRGWCSPGLGAPITRTGGGWRHWSRSQPWHLGMRWPRPRSGHAAMPRSQGLCPQSCPRCRCQGRVSPLRRVAHPSADVGEREDHAGAAGLPLAEEGGRAAVLPLLQAPHHLHPGLRRQAAPHQGAEGGGPPARGPAAAGLGAGAAPGVHGEGAEAGTAAARTGRALWLAPGGWGSPRPPLGCSLLGGPGWEPAGGRVYLVWSRCLVSNARGSGARAG